VSDTDLLEDLLERWEDERARGREVPVEELCRDHPHLDGRARREIELLRRMDWMNRSFEMTTGVCGIPDLDREGDVLERRYRLEARIGWGGFGVVWRAVDTLLGKAVAVKLPRWVPPGVGSGTGWDEFARAVRLSHPNIVPVLNAGTCEKRYYIVSQLISGGSLAERIHGGSISVEEAVRIVREIAAALKFLHRRGVIHRDLKPANVLLDAAGRVYVTDFGIAVRAAPGAAVELSTPAGTPPYMAPEQFASNSPIDHRCDLYALGVILFELLTGRRPFAGGTESELVAKLLRRSPPAPSVVNPKVSRYLDEVTRWCLADDPGERYASATELIEALEDWHRPRWRARPRRAARAGVLARAGRRVARLTGGVSRRVRAWRAAVRAVCARWITPLQSAGAAVLVGALVAVVVVVSAKAVQPLVPADPRLVVLAVVGTWLAVGVRVVRRRGVLPALFPYVLFVLAGAGLGFWLTDVSSRLWEGVVTALTRVWER
jgi:serine/threonine-protein kinase